MGQLQDPCDHFVRPGPRLAYRPMAQQIRFRSLTSVRTKGHSLRCRQIWTRLARSLCTATIGGVDKEKEGATRSQYRTYFLLLPR